MSLMNLLCTSIKNSFRLLRDRLVLERLASNIGRGRIDPRALIRVGRGCEIQLGQNIVIGAMTFISVEWDLYSDNHAKPFLHVGDGTYIGEQNNLRAAGGIQIGKKCLISQGVSIISSNHSIRRELFIIDQPSRTDRCGVSIGDDVWVGANATILPGVMIGRGAVVAAGSVVTSSVAEFDIVAGVPARFLKKRT